MTEAVTKKTKNIIWGILYGVLILGILSYHPIKRYNETKAARLAAEAYTPVPEALYHAEKIYDKRFQGHNIFDELPLDERTSLELERLMGKPDGIIRKPRGYEIVYYYVLNSSKNWFYDVAYTCFDGVCRREWDTPLAEYNATIKVLEPAKVDKVKKFWEKHANVIVPKMLKSLDPKEGRVSV